MSWDLEINTVFKNMNAPVLEPWETGRIKETIPINRYNRNEDEYVDIMTCDNPDEVSIVPDPFKGVAESSGSFGDTENAAHASFGDPEVESQMYADTASSSISDDWDEPLGQRSKRVTTAHWRRFISPVMSRCKRIELKLKHLQSQERKYEKELAEHDHKKQFDYAHLRLDGCDIKSVPISGRRRRNKVMKRIKREGVEKNCDLASHMSNHPLFYYNEKANSNVDNRFKDCHDTGIGGDGENMLKFKLEDVWSSIGNYENDKSWDGMIQKIIAMESQLQNLKSRHDKVISENRERFCSVNQPSDGLNHPNIKPDSFAGTASSGDDKTVALIEAADRAQPYGSWGYIDDEDLTQYHQLAKIELHELEIIGNQMINQLESIKENAVHNVNMHSTLKSCSTLKSNIPRNKRKRENISGRKKRSRISD